MTLHPVLARVTETIAERSRDTRAAYLHQIDLSRTEGPARGRLGCGNFAHGFAGAEPVLKEGLRQLVKPNIAIVSAYNDVLSAHAPFETYPQQLKKAVMKAGGLAQFAGGVPAMCDGVTQGRAGMELSLFSRDVIAMSTALALSHDLFDGTLLLGVCDKIVPGMLIGALSFGHLPTLFVPAGPMRSGMPNSEKAKIRELYAEGKISREELLDAEAASYHSEGTCTFYGTANSNQLLMEVMGLHLPGSTFVNPGTPLRSALTDAAGARAVELVLAEAAPVGHVVDEKAVVNAAVALLATGGSTNHTLHLPAIAAAAGIQLTWDDFSELSQVVPLLAHVYPNGSADINHYQAAGGLALTIRTLLEHGLLHEDVTTISGQGLSAYLEEPKLIDGALTWTDGPTESLDPQVLRTADDPFSPEGGLRVLEGNLGKSVVKVSAIPEGRRVVTAPAVVFEDQKELLDAFDAGELERDFVAVVRFQGPAANGMPELHKLTPPLGVLQGKGFKVAIVTDGRMSGASGKVLAAIHVTPEAAHGGPLAKVQDGDVVTVDADTGELLLHVTADELALRTAVTGPDPAATSGTGRELFAGMRRSVGTADTGASFFTTRHLQGVPVA